MSACPHCYAQMLDAPELAGQMVRCPACQREFQLPPQLWTEADPPPVVEAPPVVPRPRTQPSRRGPVPTDWPKTIRQLMFIFTLVWGGAIVVMLVLHFGLGLVSISHSSGPYYVMRDGSVVDQTNYILGLIIGAGLWGFCCPTAPYVVVMVILGTALLSTKKDGS